MITEDYISVENARLLKEKGFNEPCRLYYDKYHGCVPIFVEDSKLTEYGYKELVRNDQNSISDFIATAPSLYVAMKWLREIYGLNIQVCIVKTIESKKAYNATIYSNDCEQLKAYFGRNIFDGFNSYEEAAEEAIKYCLINLI